MPAFQLRDIDSKMASSNVVSYEYIKNLAPDSTELLIDVREPAELQETGTLPNSVNIPLNNLEETFLKLSMEEFKSKVGKTKPDKDAIIIVSCKLGGRSAKAQGILTQLGYKNVKNYSGGWADWAKHLE